MFEANSSNSHKNLGNNFESCVSRTSPSIPCEIGGKAIKLTYQNTRVKSYAEPYKMYDHITVKTDDVRPVARLFEPKDFRDTLADIGFPVDVRPYPSEDAEAAFIEHGRCGIEDLTANISNFPDNTT